MSLWQSSNVQVCKTCYESAILSRLSVTHLVNVFGIIIRESCTRSLVRSLPWHGRGTWFDSKVRHKGGSYAFSQWEAETVVMEESTWYCSEVVQEIWIKAEKETKETTMINLTDHSCSHCQHQNRYLRTLHGDCTDNIKKLLKERDEAEKQRNFDRVRYLNWKIDDAYANLARIEHSFVYDDKYRIMNQRRPEKKRGWQHPTSLIYYYQMPTIAEVC